MNLRKEDGLFIIQKKNMKINTTIQHYDLEVTDTELVQKVKEAWTKAGNLVKDIKSLNLYIKTDERKVYWVINEEVTGDFEI